MKKASSQFLPQSLRAMFTILFVNIFLFSTSAQYKLRLVVQKNTTLHSEEDVYVAGNFNNWNPGDTAYKLQNVSNVLLIDFKNLPAAQYEFKFTRGSWGNVASSATGADLQNNLLVLSSDSTIYYSIDGWKDDFALAEKKHTASPNVRLVDTAFYMPQLNRNRKVMIYLPEGYDKTSKRYPVMYMHDGQNLFDEFTAGFGEWGVDECLDSLIKKGKKPCIVVAIDNGPRRLNEYNPFYFARFGEGEGDAYVNFLVATLKPFIDRKYRTMPNKENTTIAGSSMGGLISYYALLKYPSVFGKAGVFSPAFWTADSIFAMTDSVTSRFNGLSFFYMGGLEGETYLEDMLTVSEKLAAKSSVYVYTAVDPEGRHNEQAWRKWFAEFYQWITNDGYNYIIKTPD
ncbi:MAG: hypothetical protein H7X88_07430 [Gloeobacteraceae cyanobacterium ES-bin-316]|nr:hypothetical protein [Ferruginibacter sp.]